MTSSIRYFIFFIWLTCSFHASAQADSLLKLSRKAKKDTAGVLVWYELGKYYLKTGRSDSAKYVLEKTYNLSREIGYVYGEAISLQVLGNYYMAIDRDSLALDFYKRSLELATSIKLHRLVAANLCQVASIDANRGRYIEALNRYKKSYAIVSGIHDSTLMISVLVNLANLYSKMEDPGKALETLNKADAFSKKFKSNPYMAHIALTIGNMLMDKEYKAEARNYFNRAIEYARQLNDPYMAAIALSNIASLEDNFDEALRLNMESLDAFTALNSKSQVARVTLNIGHLYNKHNQYAKGLDYFLRSAELLKETGDTYGLCIVDWEIAFTYFKLDQLGPAFDYSQRDLEEAKKLGLLKYQAAAYDLLYKIYSRKGQLPQAFAAIEKELAIKDSLNSEKNLNALNTFKTRLDLEKQEEQLKAKAEIEKQKVMAKVEQERVLQRARQTRQVLISVFIGIILLLAIAFSFSLWKRFKVIEAQKKLIERQKDLVEEKQKEILDSIRYAQRIQTALLTSEKYIERNLEKLTKSKAG